MRMTVIVAGKSHIGAGPCRNKRDVINNKKRLVVTRCDIDTVLMHVPRSRSHDVPRKRLRRSPVSRDARTVAAEIMVLRCNCDTPCRHKLQKVRDIALHVVDIRAQLHQCGRIHSSETLFNALLKRRLCPTSPGKKHRVCFVFAGVQICGDAWCALHGLHMSDARVKRLLASLRRGDDKYNTNKDSHQGWRGEWCRAWCRRFVKQNAEFDPSKMTSSLDPCAAENRHMLYTSDWNRNRRASGSKQGSPLQISRFCDIWNEITSKGFTESGSTFKIKERPPRSGFTCDICTKLMERRQKAVGSSAKASITFQLKQHLQQVRIHHLPVHNFMTFKVLVHAQT